MNKLSKREIVMLYILACVIILTCSVRFLILPSIDSYNDLKSQAVETRTTEMQMRQSIDDIETIRQKTDEVNSRLAADSTTYYSPMSEWELDNLVTNLLQKHNLKPQSLSVSSPAETDIESFKKSQKATSAVTAASAQAPDTATMLISKIGTDVLGSGSDFIALSDEINSNPSMRITGFIMNDNGQNGNSAITIDIEVLMYDKNEG